MQRPSDDYVYQRQLQYSLALNALDGRLHGRHHIPCHSSLTYLMYVLEISFRVESFQARERHHDVVPTVTVA